MGGGKNTDASSSSNDPSCFYCGEEGHWYKGCKLNNYSCQHCNGVMKIFTSTTKANPARKFLRCKQNGCRGFKWVDEALVEAKTVEDSSVAVEDSSAKETNSDDKGLIEITIKGKATDLGKLVKNLFIK